MKPTLFPDLVGQDVAKRKLGFFLDGYNASSYIPHLMFVAPKGCGKTTMAKACARELGSRETLGKPKPFIELNCSTIKNVGQFFNQVVIPHMNQQECTVLFDEASELPKDVTMALDQVIIKEREDKLRSLNLDPNEILRKLNQDTLPSIEKIDEAVEYFKNELGFESKQFQRQPALFNLSIK